MKVFGEDRIDFGKRVGVSSETVRDWEQGHAVVPLGRLLQLGKLSPPALAREFYEAAGITLEEIKRVHRK